MRILVISDIDDFDWEHGTGRADVLISCGDVSDQVILEAAESYGCTTILAVKGNHDPNTPFQPPITDMHLQTKEIDGLRFGGLSGSWKYKPRGHFLFEQWEVDKYLSNFPKVDIFLAHNSPRGIHDQEDEVHYGFDGLKTYVLERKPGILIHGHQHVNWESKLGETRIIGVYGYKVIEVKEGYKVQGTRELTA
jgi:Icc-related predicted phosphoesterase